MQVFGPLGDLFDRDAERCGQFGPRLGSIRHEFVQRRVEQTEGDRQSAHRLERVFDVALHENEELVQRLHPLFAGVRQNHFAQRKERLFTVFAVEHVFGAEEADALRAETCARSARRPACRRWRGRRAGGTCPPAP